jgi:hypothetical protein
MTGSGFCLGGLKSKGLMLTNETDESSTGPASFRLEDSDGNPIFVEQHLWSVFYFPGANAARAARRFRE